MVIDLSRASMIDRVRNPNTLFSEESTVPFALIKQPIFLVGSERSGTTLLHLMLDHHPDIMFWAEFEYAVNLIDAQGNFPQLSDYYQWLQADRNFLMDGPTIDRRLSYPELVNSFLCQFQCLTEKPIVGATVHHHFDRLLTLWPDARFIHMVRDGRDVSRSCMNMGWAGNVWSGSDRWIEAEQLWETLKLQLPVYRWIEVRFEELIADPTGTLDSICQFMGDRYHPNMLNYVETTDYDLPDSSLMYQWQSKLSSREIQLLEARLGDLLEARGYTLSGLPLLKLSAWDRLRLKLQNKWGTISDRGKVYGWPLVLADFLARRLRLSALSDLTQKRINIVEIQNVKQSW